MVVVKGTRLKILIRREREGRGRGVVIVWDVDKICLQQIKKGLSPPPFHPSLKRRKYGKTITSSNSKDTTHPTSRTHCIYVVPILRQPCVGTST